MGACSLREHRVHGIGPTVTISVLQMIPLLRRAQRSDVDAMQRIRASVKENRLTSRALSEADYLQAIERDGRGWVVEVDGQVHGRQQR